MLIDEKIWQEDGFGVLDDLIPAEDCDRLRERAQTYVKDTPYAQRSVFSTITQEQSKDQYFLESGDKIRCFWEEEAFDEEGQPKFNKERCINKIGHALHDLDPIFDTFSRQKAISDLAREITDYPDPHILQSMYIFKQPYIGGEVTCHQDSSFLETKEPSLVAIWIALEDSTLENGCLWGIPGVYKQPLRSLYHRDGDRATLQILNETPWDIHKAIPLPLKKGSVLFFKGHFPHFSGANRSASSRQAYVLHLINPKAHYPKTNWLQRSIPTRGFMKSIKLR
jgi:phytanoyl-CoA hydroxylase